MIESRYLASTETFKDISKYVDNKSENHMNMDKITTWTYFDDYNTFKTLKNLRSMIVYTSDQYINSLGARLHQSINKFYITKWSRLKDVFDISQNLVINMDDYEHTISTSKTLCTSLLYHDPIGRRQIIT